MLRRTITQERNAYNRRGHHQNGTDFNRNLQYVHHWIDPPMPTSFELYDRLRSHARARNVLHCIKADPGGRALKTAGKMTRWAMCNVVDGSQRRRNTHHNSALRTKRFSASIASIESSTLFYAHDDRCWHECEVLPCPLCRCFLRISGHCADVV